MKAPENILSRWSRRKLKSVRDGDVSPARVSPEPSVAKTQPFNVEAGSGAPDMNGPAPQAYDLASLPPIESIDATADIAAFLRSGVPAALTRSALRRAWVIDPAIRDFIGVADNQWDFNDATAMPGFGPLHADQIAKLAESMRGSAGKTIERCAQAKATTPREAIEGRSVAEQHAGPAGEADRSR
jgi:hypothetical protein